MFDSDKIESNITSTTLKSFINKNAQMTKQELERNSINVVLIGDGDKVINQYPSKGTKVLSNDLVMLVTNSTNIKMPNMKGWSYHNVQSFCNLIDNKCEINGNGYVESQNIKEGDSINNNIVVNLQNR